MKVTYLNKDWPEPGKNRKTEIYNLDAIIAVGYRVNSKKQQNSEYGLLKY